MSKTKPEMYVCDICKKEMYPVWETWDKSADKLFIHTKKFDAHIECFEKLIIGEQND